MKAIKIKILEMLLSIFKKRLDETGDIFICVHIPRDGKKSIYTNSTMGRPSFDIIMGEIDLQLQTHFLKQQFGGANGQ